MFNLKKMNYCYIIKINLIKIEKNKLENKRRKKIIFKK